MKLGIPTESDEASGAMVCLRVRLFGPVATAAAHVPVANPPVCYYSLKIDKLAKRKKKPRRAQQAGLALNSAALHEPIS
ncbi:hypothetical protein NDU88_003389 [Pleurodeles waltl]|uniref:Uncharacterized protein n=1 Tax=Pleurodeles waltl TaxID=8319 RepID=A0AAV7MRI3_PLEWA|nr:hypothetical protein NDU88_003389 [Pleurodeles waltl]